MEAGVCAVEVELMPAPPCQPDCGCGKHRRTELHNMLIGRGVKAAQEINRRLGRPINQHG